LSVLNFETIESSPHELINRISEKIIGKLKKCLFFILNVIKD
jgi:hypothetical protein